MFTFVVKQNNNYLHLYDAYFSNNYAICDYYMSPNYQ